MLPYNCWHAGTSAMLAYLDEAQAQGVQIWVDMRLHVVGTPSKADWQAFITALKGHPALAGYYIADEPEWSGPDPATVSQYYRWTKEAAPEHPVAIAHSWQVRPKWAGTYDIVFMDVYAGWTGQSTGCSDSPNEFNESVRRSYQYWLDGKRAADSYGVPIHAIGLGFGYSPGTITCQGGVRNLTNREHRWHSLVPIALGYDGAFFWWDMEDPSMTVQSSPYMKGLVASRFAEISAISAEMGNGETNSAQIVVSESSDRLLYRYGVNGDRHVILTVNVVRDTAAGAALAGVELILPFDVAEVEVLFEDRAIQVVNRVIVDDSEPFEVHIYTWGG